MASPTSNTLPQPQEPRMTHAIFMGALVIYLALTMTVLDGTIVNVALPSMSKHFHVSRSTVVWVVNAYQMVIVMLLLAFASLGDLKGYKKVFLWGAIIFTAGSAVCAASFSFTMLVLARALEGVGAAAIMSVNIALIRMIYPPKFLSRGLSYNAMIVGGAAAIGPTLSGAILSIGSWHWLFIINIPIGLATWWLGVKHLPADSAIEHNPNKPKFDKVSAIESAIIFGLLINLIEGFSQHTPQWVSWTEGITILVLGYFFLHRQFKMPLPMLPVDLFKNPAFSLSISSATVNFMASMIAMVSLPFFLKEDLGYNVLHVGILLAPWPIAQMIASYFAGPLGARFNSSALAAVGMGIAAFGMWLLYSEPNNAGFWDIAWRMAVCGLGFGLYKTPNNLLLVHSSPMERTGAAGGLKATARKFGQCVGTALVAVIFRSASVDHSSRVCLLIGALCTIVALVLSLSSIRRPENDYCIANHRPQK